MPPPEPRRPSSALPSRASRRPAAGRGRGLFERRAPEARREAILAAARAILEVRDYHDIRMEDVAARAGVAKGTVYLYFPTKERLFGALTKTIFERARADWRRLAGSTRPGAERLKAVIRQQLDFFEHNRGIFLQVAQGTVPSAQGSGAPPRARMIRANILMMEENIREAMRAGHLRRADVESTAIALFGLIRGFVFASLLGGMPRRLPDQTEFVWESFFRGFRP